MGKWIGVALCSILAVVCLNICIRQFRGNGFLFNNAYIWASQKERETIDKKPLYRQSGIVFALCTAIFVCMALDCLLSAAWLWLIVAALTVAVLVYAIVSTAKQQKR